MVNEPSVDASSITLTVSAFVEMDKPTTMPKMIMDDLMIIVTGAVGCYTPRAA
jgi:hypothetical protein